MSFPDLDPPERWWSPTENVIAPSELGGYLADIESHCPFHLDELPADAVRLIPVHDDTGEHLARVQGREIARVTAERDELRAELASDEAELARLAHELEERTVQRDVAEGELAGYDPAGLKHLMNENAQLREQRAADLADLRAAATDLHTIGALVNDGRSAAYELAAARVERVIARIHHRAGETPDAG